jgi:hypothetical protein
MSFRFVSFNSKVSIQQQQQQQEAITHKVYYLTSDLNVFCSLLL